MFLQWCNFLGLALNWFNDDIAVVLFSLHVIVLTFLSLLALHSISTIFLWLALNYCWDFLALVSSRFRSWRSYKTFLSSGHFFPFELSLPLSHTHTGLWSFPWQRAPVQYHHQHPQRRLHRPDRAWAAVREGGLCYTVVWIGWESVSRSIFSWTCFLN